MSENITNDNINTSESDGKNTDESTGAVKDTDKTPSSTSDANDGKTFTQADLDRILKERLVEEKKRADKAYEKKLSDALAAKEAELSTALDNARKDAIKEYEETQKLNGIKNTLKVEYGLNDAQVDRLTGIDEKSLREDAETLFGAFKKKSAPDINAGKQSTVKDNEVLDPMQAAIRRGLDRAKK